MKKVKVDIPLVAYSSYEATIDVPDDFDISTGQSESQPEFSVVDAIFDADADVDIVGDWSIDQSYLEQLAKDNELAEVMDYE